MIKPLFDIQKVGEEFNKTHYEIYYKRDNRYIKIVDACFFTIRDARAYIDSLLEI